MSEKIGTLEQIPNNDYSNQNKRASMRQSQKIIKPQLETFSNDFQSPDLSPVAYNKRNTSIMKLNPADDMSISREETDASPLKQGSIQERWKLQLGKVEIAKRGTVIKLVSPSTTKNQIIFGDQKKQLTKKATLSSNIRNSQIIKLALESSLCDVYSFYYLIIGILAFFTEDSPKSGSWFLVAGSITFLFNFCFFVKSHNNVRRKLMLVDLVIVNLYEPLLKQFLPKKQYILQKGDIILVKKREIMPADCVLLATSGTESEVIFKEQPNDGNKQNVQNAYLLKFNSKEIANCEGNLEFEGEILFRKGGTVSLSYNYNGTSNEQNIQLNKNDVVLRGWQSVNDDDVFMIVIRTGIACKNLKHCSDSIISHAGLETHFRDKIMKIAIMLIIFSILVSLLLGLLQIIQKDSKFSGLSYLSGINQTQNYIKAFSHYIIILASIVPILQFPFIHIILKINSLKIERSEILDPQLRGLKCTVNNDNVLFNLAQAKYINVSTEALSQEAKSVSLAFVCRQVLDEIQNEQHIDLIQLEERVSEKEGFEQEELTNAFEIGLLSLSFGVRNNLDVALQNYFLQLNMIHYTQNNVKPRLIQYPDEQFKYYQQILQINLSENHQIIIYEIPFDLKQLKQIRKHNPTYKPEPTYILVSRCPYDQVKQYLDTEIGVQMDSHSEQVTIDNVFVICKKVMIASDFKQLVNLLPGNSLNMFYVNVESTEQFLELVYIKIKPFILLEIHEVYAHSLVSLVDFSRADIKTWIFTDIKEQIYLNYDATHGEVKQYFHSFELLNIQDQQQLNETMDKISQQLNLPFEQWLTHVQQNIEVNNRRTVFIVDAMTCDFALLNKQYCQQFKQLLLYPQFVYFLGCKQRLRREIISIQQEFNIESVSVIKNLSDLVLCQDKTYNIALSDEFSAYSDVVLPTFGSIPILLFNHSRLTHIRIMDFILYMTYASVALTTVELIYTYYNGYSADMFYGSSLHFLYGLVFTSTYGAIIHILKIDIQSKYFRKQSQLMGMIRSNHYFSWKRVLQSIIWGIYHGSVCILFPIYIFQGSNNDDGVMQGHYLTTMTSFILLVGIVTLKPIIETDVLQPLQILTLILNFGLLLGTLSQICSSQYARTYEPSLIYSFQIIFTTTKVFWAVIFIPLGILFPNFFIQINFKVFAKSPHTLAMKSTQIEIDEEYLRFQERQARNIIREEEEQILEQQSMKGIIHEKYIEVDQEILVKEAL